MAKIRRVVRKLEPAERVFFDEQLWPINIALIVLGCFLIGMSLAYQPLWAAPWYATAWPSLLGVPLFIAACLIAFRHIDSRLIRRSLQLSIILGAIAHVAFVIHMIETRIFSSFAMGETAKAKLSERPPPKIIPEYHPTLLIPEEDRPRQDFEKPVETQTPEPTRQPEQIVRQPSEQDRSPSEPQPVPIPEQQRTTEPNVVNRQSPNEVAPRLAAQTSQLSRQAKPSEARTSQPIATPQPLPEPSASAAASPTAVSVNQERTEPTPETRTSREPATESASRVAQLARQTSQPTPNTASSASTALPRTGTQPAAPQSRALAVDAPTPTNETATSSPSPATATPTRQPTAASAIARRATEPIAQAADARSATPQRRDSAPADQPAIAGLAASPRRVANSSQPNTTTTAVQQASNSSPSAITSVADVTPRASTVERAAAEVTSGAPSPNSSTEPRTVTSISPAASIARAQGPENPIATLQPSTAPGNLPRRAVTTASATTSPRAAESPATAVATTSTANPLAQPSQVALSRGQAGTAGSGRSTNLDSSIPGNDSPALVASGAARRAESTQQSPAGDAFAPSSPAQLARSRAGASLPSSAIKAEAAPLATAAGSTQVAEAPISSSAALTESSAAARKDAVTASKGVGEVDLGPTQMVAEAGIGRAAGGGQPGLSFQTPSPQVARAKESGGAPLIALASADVGDVAAPPGRDGGAASTPRPTDVAAARATSGDLAGGGALVNAPAPSAPAEADGAAAIVPAVSRAGDDGSEIAASGAPDIRRFADDDQGRRLVRAAAGGATGPAATQVAPLPSSDANAIPPGSTGGTVAEATTLVPSRAAADAPSSNLERATNPGTLATTGTSFTLPHDPPGRRASAAADDNAPSIGELTSASASGRATTAAALGSSTAIDDIPEVGPTSAVAQAEIDHQLIGTGQSLRKSQLGDALAIDITAPTGPGGLGSDYSPDVGINTRQAKIDSLNVQLRTARFVRSEVGGLPAVSTSAVVATDAFSSRGARVRGELPAGGRGTPAPQTEEAIERGLAFLARHQAPDGGWSLQGFPEGAQLATDTAATALAVIAFQGAGYNHREFQYKEVVRGGIDFLLKSQKENGDLFVPLDDASNRSVWLYSHSLAAIALCEAYGMTQDPALRAPAQRALDFIVASQHRERWDPLESTCRHASLSIL